jgi:proteic killer suppression protein
LAELFATGRSKRVPSEQRKRIAERLDLLSNAKTLEDINQPGLKLHYLVPTTRLAIWVTGSWRITFDFANGQAINVDLEQYH